MTSQVTQDHAKRWRFRDDNLKFFALIDIRAKKNCNTCSTNQTWSSPKNRYQGWNSPI